jgi:hypothetical protein
MKDTQYETLRWPTNLDRDVILFPHMRPEA